MNKTEATAMAHSIAEQELLPYRILSIIKTSLRCEPWSAKHGVSRPR
ncbi:hypothetical protein Psal006b_02348 [Piscirickettsia salmonis]|uniref:Transposase n=1 Tax=Piscirickettsia salmonis TaxID=1238 RepID=A0AAC8VGA6_PISSA|nr:hypothetical protein [Piscirickettsia salmonis]ALB22042.1 transposase [Piscirickettsia salmonis]QGN99343.1 hypothetical protein Psal006b_02348 [Piscirickettsia salmonis]QGO02976.1 hypothetical protein Psal008_02368 [Piscirickettsia salmonis]QGO13635.1 hypothetical protein Psal010b_02344 [Piscirickettsia salmonis]QGO20711.1 hypothetical protein Psal013_02376 [Piscirickettsia salmonis]